MSVLLIIAIVLSFLTADYLVQRYGLRRAERADAPDAAGRMQWLGTAGAHLLPPPPAFFVSGEHAWAHLDSEGFLRIGVDAFAGVLMGDLDEVRVRPAGTELRRGEPVATLRRGPLTIDVRAPADGVVVEHNLGLSLRPDYVVRDPFGDGWLCRLAPADARGALGGMRVGGEARDFTRAELGRLRDALARQAAGPALVGATLADGGTPAAGWPAALAPAELQELAATFFGGGACCGGAESRVGRTGSVA